MFKTKTSKLIGIAITFVLLLSLGLYSINLFEENKRSYYLEVQSKLLQAKYDTSFKNFKIMSNDIFSMYAQNTKVIDLFTQAQDANRSIQNKIRNEIYLSLAKNYKRLNNMGVSQIHFHLPSNISFLRMFKKRKFGDDLSEIRPSVALTNKTKFPQSGFETCQFMSGFRFLYPIINSENKHIGSVGVSYEGDTILKSITDNFVYDSHILVAKSMIDTTIKNTQEKKRYKDTWETQDYYLDTSIHKKIGDTNLYNKISTKELKDKIDAGIKTKKTFTLVTKYNYKNIILTFLPIAAADGTKNISYIVTYAKSDYLENIQIQENYIQLMYFGVLSLLFLFSIYLVYNQEKLKVLALYDDLTKLPNRTLFTIEFQNEINRAYRYKTKLALLFFDFFLNKA